MRPALLCTITLALSLSCGAHAASRFEEFTKKFAQTADRAEVIASTYLGSSGTEWLTAGGVQPDGTIVAAGVTLGPTLDLGTQATVLGSDRPIAAPTRQASRRGGRIQVDKEGKPQLEPLAWNHPNATAFITRLSPDLKQIKSVTRLGWKLGGLTGALVADDGHIYICGPATNGIATISTDHQHGAVTNKTQRATGCTQAYLARLSPDATKALWVRTVSGPSGSPQISFDRSGNLLFISADIRAFSPAGQQLSIAPLPGRTEPHLAINPIDQTIAAAGEHHWSTGREPYRDPILNIYKPDGTWLYELYNWDGPFVGLNDLRLVAGSAIRGAAYDPDGTLVLHAWSEGTNSVLTREPTDPFTEPKTMHGLGFNTAGAGVLGCSYLIKLDPKTWRITNGTLWLGYLADRDKPNSVTINSLGVARDGSICIGGSSAWGLIQTGNAFTNDPSGDYVAILGKDLSSLRFSSALPGTGQAELTDSARWGFGSGTVNGRTIALFFSAAAPDSEPATPTANARQEKPAGGFLDGHILALDLSPKR